VSLEVGCTLHRSGIRTNRRITDDFGIPRHARKAIGSLAQDDHFSARIRIDNAGGPGDFRRARGHRAGDPYLDRLRVVG